MGNHGESNLIPAIWSLCVSDGDLVTEVVDIENVGDLSVMLAGCRGVAL